MVVSNSTSQDLQVYNTLFKIGKMWRTVKHDYLLQSVEHLLLFSERNDFPENLSFFTKITVIFPDEEQESK